MKFNLYKGFNYNITESTLFTRLEQLRSVEHRLTEELGNHLAEMIKLYVDEQFENNDNIKKTYNSGDEYLKKQKNLLIDDFVNKAKKQIKQQVRKKLKNI